MVKFDGPFERHLNLFQNDVRREVQEPSKETALARIQKQLQEKEKLKDVKSSKRLLKGLQKENQQADPSPSLPANKASTTRGQGLEKIYLRS